MKRVQMLMLVVLTLPAAAFGQGSNNASSQTQASQPATLTSILDRQIDAIEKLIIDAAEAMPEEKFNFSPERLTIPGSDFKGVRTFAGQVKHVASSNYLIW